MVKEYHCPNCGAYESMSPFWKGKSRMYRCDDCGKLYSSKQLDKEWKREGSPKGTLTVVQ